MTWRPKNCFDHFALRGIVKRTVESPGLTSVPSQYTDHSPWLEIDHTMWCHRLSIQDWSVIWYMLCTYEPRSSALPIDIVIKESHLNMSTKLLGPYGSEYQCESWLAIPYSGNESPNSNNRDQYSVSGDIFAQRENVILSRVPQTWDKLSDEGKIAYCKELLEKVMLLLPSSKLLPSSLAPAFVKWWSLRHCQSDLKAYMHHRVQIYTRQLDHHHLLAVIAVWKCFANLCNQCVQSSSTRDASFRTLHCTHSTSCHPVHEAQQKDKGDKPSKPKFGKPHQHAAPYHQTSGSLRSEQKSDETTSDSLRTVESESDRSWPCPAMMAVPLWRWARKNKQE